MTLAIAALTALAGPSTPTIALDQIDEQVSGRSVTMTQRVIIRIPRMATPPSNTRPHSELKWDEKRAPRCMPTARIAAAAVGDRRNIDLLTIDGQRMRARLDRACETLDFYSGFYLRHTPDGEICARRDSIRTRSGSTCRIEAFRRLVLDD